MIGFCLSHQSNVEIDQGARCLVDGTRTIAPSTGCVHQSWTDGAWSPCIPIEGEIQRRTCKPYHPDQWRTVLSQQARAIVKRDADRAARQFSASAPKPPRLKTAHKTTRGIGPSGIRRQMVVCADCHEEKIHSGKGRCDRCYRRLRRREKAVAA